ncbi:Hsp20/alpha crystallin family protein [Litorivivens sp.]|uniref:Hsp20/alpha crystallin family protein n=1 Tax=Litorivivens sp. TaxID=2020868 RepID=UPI003561E5B2
MHLIPRDSLNNIFDHVFSGLRHDDDAERNGFFSPSVDIEERDGKYVLTADLPGVSKEDISVELDDGILTLRAERHEESEEKEKGRVIRRERRSGSYARSFSVGHGVSGKDITASFKNGTLTLSLPKPQPAAPSSHRIQVQ